MNFDREYHRASEPRTPDDFIDSNVQAEIEGRRKKPAPRPNVRIVNCYVNDRSHTVDLMQILAQGLLIKPEGNW